MFDLIRTIYKSARLLIQVDKEVKQVMVDLTALNAAIDKAIALITNSAATQAQLDQAKADLAAAQATISQLNENDVTAQAGVDQATSKLVTATGS